MPNSTLNKSTHFLGELITGTIVISVDTEDPADPPIDILNAGLQMIVKENFTDSDEDALANLTIGNGLEITSNTSTLYDVVYRIPGSATQDLTAPSDRDSKREIYYEINITFDGEVDSDVLEIGTIKIETRRVKSDFS